jgi:hypothetical protein
VHVISAVGAVIVCAAIGASVDGLARHYAMDGTPSSATRLAVSCTPSP